MERFIYSTPRDYDTNPIANFLKHDYPEIKNRHLDWFSSNPGRYDHKFFKAQKITVVKLLANHKACDDFSSDLLKLLE